MDTKIRALLIGVLISIVGIIITTFVFKYALSVATVSLSFLVGAVVAIVMIATSRGENPKDVAMEVVDQVLTPNPYALKHRVEEQLYDLNLELRRTYGVLDDVIQVSEEVISLLLSVVPRAMESFPGSEATFDLEKISTDHLPKVLKDFLALSNEDQIEAEEVLITQLQDLKKNVLAAEKAVDDGNLDEFKISSSFLKAKTV